MEKNLVFTQSDFMVGLGGASILTGIVFLMTFL